MQTPSPRKTLSIHALMAVVVFFWVAVHPNSASAQDAAWSLYEDAVDAAERGEYDEALVLYRQAERVVTDDVLSRAVCYGSGLVARKLIERESIERRSLACQGVEWFDCYLDEGDFEDKEVERIARRAREQLHAICEPEADGQSFNPWPWAGLAGGTGVVGAALFIMALGDASQVRETKAANNAVGGETLEQVAQLGADEDNARIKHGVGLGLVTVGVGVAAWLMWKSTAEESGEEQAGLKVEPLGISVAW